jgi:hypothetical protein
LRRSSRTRDETDPSGGRQLDHCPAPGSPHRRRGSSRVERVGVVLKPRSRARGSDALLNIPVTVYETA